MIGKPSIWLVGLATALCACHPWAAIGPPATGGHGVEGPRVSVLEEPEDSSYMDVEDPSDGSYENPSDTPVEAPSTPPVEASTATAAEKAVLAAINRTRASYGLTTLAPSNALRELSLEHCRDMVNRHYFNHITPDGLAPYQRVRAANVAFSACGETSHYPDVRPMSAIADWLRHPGGKSQLLDARFTLAGVGIAYAPVEKRYYVNVIYLRP
jgi:uncharacterized protein YkwD